VCVCVCARALSKYERDIFHSIKYCVLFHLACVRDTEVATSVLIPLSPPLGGNVNRILASINSR
jgi:hypothetical protein